MASANFSMTHLYTLSVSINPSGLIAELLYENNAALVDVVFANVPVRTGPTEPIAAPDQTCPNN
jgi:hypothetical protein